MNDRKAAGPQAILDGLPHLLAGLGLAGGVALVISAIVGIFCGSPFDRDA